MKLRLPFLLALGLLLVIAAAAPALVIETGNENWSAPSPDPGWENVCFRSAYNAVYLGAGWVLTANHVGAGDTYFQGGLLYPWVPGSDVQLSNPDSSPADLVLFRLAQPYPPLPALALSIPAAAPGLGTNLVLIARGRKRGAPTTWNPPGPTSYDGFLWDFGGYMRWGTNFVEAVLPPDTIEDFESAFGTQLFASVFHQSGGGHSSEEAQGADGDSGGAVFADTGTGYQLAGILVGIGAYANQPAATALYGNYTFAADLSVYRAQIVATMPEPPGGLWAGIALLAVLSSAGTRRACRGTACAASSPPRA